MKSAFLASILICVIAGTLVVSKQKGNTARPLPCPCENNWMGYTREMNVKGYYIVKCKSLEKLQGKVLGYLESNEGWRPFGGVTIDPNEEQYLQVIVHPRIHRPTSP